MKNVNADEWVDMMKNVNADEWAAYVSQFRTYQTEYNYGAHSVMYSKLAIGPNVGMEIAEVHYCKNGNKFYFILCDCGRPVESAYGENAQ